MRHFTRITTVTIIFSIGHVCAQTRTSLRDMVSQKASPGIERARLNFLVGNFTTETSIPAGRAAPNGATGKGTTVVAWALDSMFLVIDEQSTNSLFGQFKGHGVLGYDPHTQKFMLSMFNNFGDHPSYTGTFVEDTLMLETTVALPGRSFEQKVVWYKAGDAVKLKC